MNDRTSNRPGLTKVVFELDESDWHDHATESVWALPLRHDRYRIQNVPFYAYGVSYDDVVLAKPRRGQLVVQGVSQRGGHSTYRVILTPGTTHDKLEEAFKDLGSLGCTYERATDRLVAIDVPPESDIYRAYAALETGEKAGIGDFEEVHCGHPLESS